jgi:LysM repeat protein
MDDTNIRSLEQRYQTLRQDFEAGNLDETAFVAEVDKLQFQDGYGRYWMLGAKTGSWHYYDGQAWHQADPYQADSLPFMDEQGQYWQRGQKSGDWYYYQPETGEWVKPGQSDAVTAPNQYGGQPPAGQDAGYAGYQADYGAQPSQPSLADFDGELYQDAEGRYWSIGKKTGQWYFFDRDGWHPAQEFQAGGPASQPTPVQPGPAYEPRTADSWSAAAPSVAYEQREQRQPYNPQPQPGAYQSPAQNYGPPLTDTQTMGQPSSQPVQAYVVQPQQPTSPTQPIQIYITSQGQETRPVSPQPQPAPYVDPHPLARPAPQPQPEIVSAPEPPPQTAPTIIEAKKEPDTFAKEKPEPPTARPPKERSESGSWFYFDGDQWLKYASGEPDEASPTPPKMTLDQEPKPAPAKKKATEAPVVAEYFDDDEPPVEVVDVEVITVVEAEVDAEPEPVTAPVKPEPAPTASQFRPQPQPASDPTIPIPRRRQADQPQRQARPRVPSEPVRPAMPRRRESAQEPTILIPTGSAASSITPAAPAARASRPTRPQPDRQRRARENTIPMEAIESEKPVSASAPHHRVTREMPRQTPDPAPAKPSKPAVRQTRSAAEAATEKVEKTESKKSRFTLGELLRSMPSTIWTFVGGLVLLLACAAGLILSWGWLQGGNLDPESLVAVPSLTPTLNAGPPDATPTPGPTPTNAPEPTVVATPAAMTIFSSKDLGYTVEYPETWRQKDDKQCGAFSPSTPSLTRDDISDATIWICKSTEEDVAITDLLTEVLADFPTDAETLNEGTISIASQTWTSAQIRYDSEAFDGQGISTLAVTSKDSVGYYLVAVAPADAWNATQPVFQAIINSFTFSTDVIAQASASDDEPEETESGTTGKTRTPTPQEKDATPKASPTPRGTVTPLVYVVQSGDTLLGIALEFEVDAELLAARNNIDSPESLQIGQELIIPFGDEDLAALAAESDEEDETELAATVKETPTPDVEDETLAEPTPAPTEAPAEAATVSGRIVYPAFNPGTSVYDVWQVDLATQEQVVVAGESSQPAFNKDGSLLAYRAWMLGDRGIVFRDYVGGRGGFVTRFVEDSLPSWSPDGYSFAFTSRREGDRVSRLYLGNQLGEDVTALGFQATYVSTFSDGRLLVKGCTVTGDCGIFVMGATGGGETKISGEFGDNTPAPSPDGSKVAFMSSERGATNWEIWVMNADGSNPQRLTENGSNDGLPAWSPDGQSIAFVSDQGGTWAIWAMNADGSNQRKLVNMQGSPEGQVLRDTNNSKGWLEERISWAP